jgi:DNA-binding CsgD family transcriptional regulator
VGGRSVYAYRWVYERERGPIPEGSVLHHTCRNTRCLNPDHVVVTTQSEHISGHLTGVPKSAAANAKLAETQAQKQQATGQARLTERGVRVIRGMAAAGRTQREIAAYFGIDRRLVGSVLTGTNYGRVE